RARSGRRSRSRASCALRSAKGSKSAKAISPLRWRPQPLRPSTDAATPRRGGTMAKPVYRRVIVKVSGEALSGPDGFGIHQPTIDRIARDLVGSRKLGVKLGVVVGGGNILRGAQIS